jgi:hypothetical protein
MSLHQTKDAGLALVLICLLAAYFAEYRAALLLAIVLLVATMTVPGVFRPFAKLWFGLSHTIGTVMSKVLLSILYGIMVVPVGLLRRALGKDAMRFKEWQNGSHSVLRVREHTFSAADLDNPY